MVAQLAQLLAVVFAQFLRAGVQAAKHPLVRGQHQRAGRQPLQPRERLQPQLQRVGLGLDAGDQHVGADARQQLVARDQDLVLRAVQAGVLGRMAFADDHAPGARAQRDVVAAAQPVKRLRLRRHEGVGAHGFPHAFGALGRHTRARVEHLLGAWQRVRHRLGQRAHHEIFAVRHVQRDAKALAQPVGQARMVVVHVRTHQARNGQALQVRGGNVLPAVAGSLRVQAGVDQRPAVVTAQQIDVDVVQRHRHGHARPQNARRHLDHRAVAGRRAEGVVQHRAGVQPRHARALCATAASCSGT